MIQKRTKSVHFNARLPRAVADRLKEYASRRRLTASAAAVELLDEALRMERFPGIDFRWTPGGRRAHVTGTGLAAWELHMIWRDHKGDLRKALAHYPHLRAEQVQTAAAYIREHPEEIPDLRPPAYVSTVRA